MTLCQLSDAQGNRQQTAFTRWLDGRKGGDFHDRVHVMVGFQIFTIVQLSKRGRACMQPAQYTCILDGQGKLLIIKLAGGARA